MKFILLVEGDAEKLAIAEFLKRWLDPQLKSRVGIRVVNFHGNSQLVRKIAHQGARSILTPPRPARSLPSSVCSISTDLKSIRRTLPRCRNATTGECSTSRSRSIARSSVCSSRFTSSRLGFSGSPTSCRAQVRDALPGTVANPERVDFDEPPAKLLNRVYLSRTRKNYKKTTYGKQLFGKLAPEVVAEKCPYLKAMLDEMLKMAKVAGL